MIAVHASSLLALTSAAPALIEPGLLLGFMLLAAFAGAGLARVLHIPRVVGFLGGGVLLKLLIVALASRDPNLDSKAHTSSRSAPGPCASAPWKWA